MCYNIITKKIKKIQKKVLDKWSILCYNILEREVSVMLWTEMSYEQYKHQTLLERVESENPDFFDIDFDEEGVDFCQLIME